MDEKDRQLLQEVNERLIRIEKYQQAERTRRYIRLGVIALIIIILAIIIVPKIVAIVNQYNQMMAQVDNITAKFNGIVSEVDGITADFNDLKGKIDKIDFSALQDAISQIQSFVDKLSRLYSGGLGSIFSGT